MQRAIGVLLVAAAAVLLVLLTRQSSESDRSSLTPEPGETEEGAAPVLKAAGSQAATPPSEPIEPRGRFTIRGKVLLDGEPAAARIEVRDLRYNRSDKHSLLLLPYSDGPLLGEAEAGSDGTFLVEGLAVGAYEVHALSDTGRTAWQRAFVYPFMPEPVVHLHLLGGEEVLEGRAVYSDDRPFRGFVWAGSQGARPGWGSPFMRPVETDAEGRFRMTGLPEGRISLSFVVPERVNFWFTKVAVPQAGEALFIVDEDLLALQGTVVADDDGTPLPAVRMSWDSQKTGGTKRVIAAFETDESGTFRCLVPGHGGVIWARKEGFSTLQYPYTEEKGLQLRLKRQGTVTGTVVRKDTQAPLEGIALQGMNWYAFDLPSPLARTAADGTFSLSIGPGKGTIYVFGDGWVLDTLPKLTGWNVRVSEVEIAQAGTADIRLEVIPTGRVRGTVRDLEGKPAAGVPIQLMHAPQWRGFNHRSEDELTTGADGTFESAGLVPGFPYVVRASPPEGLPATSPTFSAASGETATVDLQLVEGTALKIQFLEEGTGKPIPGVQVFGSQDGKRLNGTTDANGLLVFEQVLRLPYRLSVRHGDYLQPGTGAGPFARGLNFPAPKPGDGPRVIALERGYRFEGRLLDPDGAPWTKGGGLGIHAVGERPGLGLGLTGLMQIQEEGTFNLGPVPAGTYDLMLHGIGNVFLSRWTLKAGQSGLALRIDPAQAEKDAKARVTITAVDAAGQPVEGWLRLSAADGSYQELRRMQVGTFECRVARAGDVVWLHLWEMKSKQGQAAGSAYLGPVTLKPGENPLTLPAPLTIAGHVTDGEDKPVSGVLLQFLPVSVDGAPVVSSTFAMPAARTQADGSFLVDGLGPGRQRVVVSAPTVYGMVPVRVVEAGDQHVEIRLGPAQPIEVRVRDPEGMPVAGAKVEVTWPDAAMIKRTALSDAMGIAKLEGVSQEAVCRLAVRPPAAATDLAAHRQDDWRPGAVTVTLAKGRRIRGKLRGASGPAPVHKLWWKDTRGRWQSVRSTASGRFEFTALGGSPVTVRVAPMWSTSESEGGPPVTLAPGQDAPLVDTR